jgi:hypothetical protein
MPRYPRAPKRSYMAPGSGFRVPGSLGSGFRALAPGSGLSGLWVLWPRALGSLAPGSGFSGPGFSGPGFSGPGLWVLWPRVLWPRALGSLAPGSGRGSHGSRI